MPISVRFRQMFVFIRGDIGMAGVHRPGQCERMGIGSFFARRLFGCFFRDEVLQTFQEPLAVLNGEGVGLPNNFFNGLHGSILRADTLRYRVTFF